MSNDNCVTFDYFCGGGGSSQRPHRHRPVFSLATSQKHGGKTTSHYQWNYCSSFSSVSRLLRRPWPITLNLGWLLLTTTKQEKILLLFFLSALYQYSRLLFQDSRTFHTKYYSQFILLKCTNRRYVLVLLYHISTYYTRILYSVKETIKRRIACCFAFIVSITVGGLEKWLKSGLRQVS